MASCGWGSDTSVIAWLETEPWRFGFFQAVRILERTVRPLQPLGEGGNPDHEAVRLASRVNWAFPATEVADLLRERRGHGLGFADSSGFGRKNAVFYRHVLEIDCLGLAGALGPLPEVLTQHLLDRGRAGDTALKDFLDIFNHRLASLLYRLRCRLRPGFSPNSPADRGDVARTMFCLAGMGTGGLRTPTPEKALLPVVGRAQVPDAALFAYVSLLADERRSMVGLETLLAIHFGVPVRGRQFRGEWVRISRSDWSVLGRKGRNRQLGRDAVLGKRFWDPEAGIALHLGPVNLDTYCKLLPCDDAVAFKALCGLVRLYAGRELDVDVELCLAAREVPRISLKKGQRERLGLTTFLRGARPMPKDGVLHYRLPHPDTEDRT
jgi:type VI secretion system protein ImpH